MEDLVNKNYKEKYDKVLEWARNFYNSKHADLNLRITLEDVFPELKEREDERIRKNLREFLLDAPSQDIVSHHLDLEETLNWLEKQGEQTSADKIEPKFKVGDVVRNISNGDTVTITQINKENQFYNYSGWDGVATVHSDFSISEQDNWELVEQKHTWSEEDEKKITGILMVLESWDSYHVSSAGLPSFIPEYISWLKSLKERMKGGESDGD